MPQILIAAAILLFLILFFTFIPVGWRAIFFSGVSVKISSLIGMRLRRVVPSRIINPRSGDQTGVKLNTDQLEAHYLAGGNVNTLVDALIAAQRAEIPWNLNVQPPLTWPDGMYWKPCRSASIRKSLKPRLPPWQKTGLKSLLKPK